MNIAIVAKQMSIGVFAQLIEDVNPQRVIFPAGLPKNFESFRAVYDGPMFTPDAEVYELAPGWVSVQVLVQVIGGAPGMAAIELARQLRINAVVAHTGHLAMINHSIGFKGKVERTFTGMEVSKDGVGILEVSDNGVRPMLVSTKRKAAKIAA